MTLVIVSRDGKWKRRKFRDRGDAEAFVALKSVEMLNQDTRLREVVTTLSKEQVKEAEAAFNRLRELEREGDTSRRRVLEHPAGGTGPEDHPHHRQHQQGHPQAEDGVK